MVFEAISASAGDGVELMVGQLIAEHTSRRRQGAKKSISWVFHAVLGEDGFEASFVESFVVSYQGQAFDEAFDLLPYFRKCRGIGGITGRETVDTGCPVCVIVGDRAYKAVETSGLFSVANDHNADGAYA